MCGIASIYQNGQAKPKDRIAVQAMLSDLKHRGPDSQAATTEGGVSLLHCRLSVLGSDDVARQPITSWDRTVTLTFNGEIYNWEELASLIPEKKDLIRKSGSDSRLIVELLAEFDLNFIVSKLRGMYSFIFLKNSKLFATRDKFGQKPLFYFRDSEVLVIASEINPILNFLNFTKRSVDINQISARHFLITGYTPPGLTLYNQIHSVLPNEVLEFSLESENFLLRSEYSPFDFVRDIDVQGLGLREALLMSISEQLMADVKVGIWLSGGVDSSTIAMLAAKELGFRGSTFSVSFPESEILSEQNAAAFVAKEAGLDHHSIPMTLIEAEMIIDIFESIGVESLGDPSVLPSLYLSKLTREHCTVALAGDGADELFLGYPRHYKTLYRPRLTSSRFMHNYFNLHYPPVLDFWSDNLNKSQIRDWDLSGSVPRGARKLQSQDRFGYLAQNILVKTDRCAMANSLEVRSPFLDERVAAIAYSMSQRELITKLTKGKTPVKNILAQYLPREFVNRGKMGFTPPLDLWLRTSLFRWSDKVIRETDWRCLSMDPSKILLAWKNFLNRNHNNYFSIWALINLGIALRRI